MTFEEPEYEKRVPSPFERGFERLAERLVPLVPARVTPNQLTALSFAAGLFAAAAFFLAGVHRAWFWAAAAGVFGHLLGDSLDGVVARERGMRSPRGHFFDQFSDVTAAIAIFLGIGFSSYTRIEVMLFPAVLYPYHLMVMLHWINLTGQWPFPRFGPFELHFVLIVLAVVSAIAMVQPVVIAGYGLGLFDLVALVAVPLSLIELFASAVRLFRRLPGPG
jgi:phosphatidylglycerophosphate synthase